MKNLLSILIGLIGLSVVATDADAARRLGGGRNLGMQRSAPAQQQRAAPVTPPQQQAAPAAPASQPQSQPGSLQRWLGPLAGLALGAGLAALFFNNGTAGLFAGALLIGLVVAAIMFAARVLTRGRMSETEEPLQYAGFPAGAEPSPVFSGGAGADSVAATTASAAGSLPSGFDAAEFARHAKLNFVRLQEAHDKKDLTTMRDFLTPGLYREIESDILAAGDAPHHTAVVTLDAEVIDVVEEAVSYVVSMRFSGLIREDGAAEPEPFSEIWHLEKPRSGRSGWLVAGIQQS